MNKQLITICLAILILIGLLSLILFIGAFEVAVNGDGTAA